MLSFAKTKFLVKMVCDGKIIVIEGSVDGVGKQNKQPYYTKG